MAARKSNFDAVFHSARREMKKKKKGAEGKKGEEERAAKNMLQPEPMKAIGDGTKTKPSILEEVTKGKAAAREAGGKK